MANTQLDGQLNQNSFPTPGSLL